MTSALRLAGTTAESIVDGPGLRYTVFVQGCPHGCPGCHNPQTHDFSAGFDKTVDELADDIARYPHLKGVTFSGGEPFCQAEGLYRLGRALKAQGRSLMAFTGYLFEELLALPDPYVGKLLGLLDLLVDGRFVQDQRTLELRFRGSANQRVLDVPASLKAGAAVWAQAYQ